MRSRDPLDVPIALRIGRGTLRKMRQNLWWAVGYNVIALPIAAGVLKPVFGFAAPGDRRHVDVGLQFYRRRQCPDAQAPETAGTPAPSASSAQQPAATAV